MRGSGVLAVLLVLTIIGLCYGLSVKIEPLNEQCFWEEVKKQNVSLDSGSVMTIE